MIAATLYLNAGIIPSYEVVYLLMKWCVDGPGVGKDSLHRPLLFTVLRPRPKPVDFAGPHRHRRELFQIVDAVSGGENPFPINDRPSANPI